MLLFYITFRLFWRIFLRLAAKNRTVRGPAGPPAPALAGLNTPVTARNWKTLNKLRAMIEE
jgi:hypothetical protein